MRRTSDQKPLDGMFFPSQDQEGDGTSGINNYNVPPSVIIPHDPLSLWRSPPPFSSISLQEAHETAAAAADYSYILNDLSTAFEDAPSSLPLQQLNPGDNWITESRAVIQNEPSSGVSIEDQMVHESARYSDYYTLNDLSNFGVTNPRELIPFSEEIILHGLGDKGQSSGTKRKQASDSLEMQTEESEEDGAKAESKQKKRTHNNAQAHNLNNRLRRKKFQEKLKALQELIPRCNKRDKESILDDAIKYIKILQNQVQQKGSSGARFPMSLFPWMMPPQPGTQIPTFPQFLHTFPRMGMGMPYPMGLPSPCLMGSANSGLSASGVPNPGNVFTTQGEITPTERSHNKLT